MIDRCSCFRGACCCSAVVYIILFCCDLRCFAQELKNKEKAERDARNQVAEAQHTSIKDEIAKQVGAECRQQPTAFPCRVLRVTFKNFQERSFVRRSPQPYLTHRVDAAPLSRWFSPRVPLFSRGVWWPAPAGVGEAAVLAQAERHLPTFRVRAARYIFQHLRQLVPFCARVLRLRFLVGCEREPVAGFRWRSVLAVCLRLVVKGSKFG